MENSQKFLWNIYNWFVPIQYIMQHETATVKKVIKKYTVKDGIFSFTKVKNYYSGY